MTAGVTTGAAHDVRQRRHRRAAVAQLLLVGAPAAAGTLDWDALDTAPAWLARTASSLATLQCQVGAVLLAPAMRLWIDSGRLAAARAVLGEGFLRAALDQVDLAAVAAPRIASASQVGAALQSAGAAVLLATLPAVLRGPAAGAMTPPAGVTIAESTAQAVVARALSLAAETTP
jgi:hypothetical protein